MLKQLFIGICCCLPLTVLAQPDISDTELQELLKIKRRTVETFAHNPVLVKAVREQNAQNQTLETIQERDEKWSGTDKMTPFKLALQRNKTGRYLKRVVDGNDAFSEAFLTDNQGANVAAYPVTSDYWQGDEEKWTASFNNGDGVVFVGPLEEDSSTNAVQVQVSAPVIDRGATIGVLVMGVNLGYIESKQN